MGLQKSCFNPLHVVLVTWTFYFFLAGHMTYFNNTRDVDMKFMNRQIHNELEEI